MQKISRNPKISLTFEIFYSFWGRGSKSLPLFAPETGGGSRVKIRGFKQCGKPYRRASWTAYSKKRIVWRCLNRLEYGKKHCQKSPTIDEDVLHRAIMDAFNSLIQDKGDFVDTLQSNIQLVMGNRVKQMDIAKIEERIAELKKEMIGFVEENARCGADNTDFDEHYAKISAELKELQEIKTQYTEQQARQDSF